MSESEILTKIADDVAYLKERMKHMESLLGEIVYPGEDVIKEDFIERVEASEERIEKGKGQKFKDMSKFLESVEQ